MGAILPNLRQLQPESPHVQFRVIVVGAGLAGLATALSCALNGQAVIVLESAKELAEVGAGLQITPNASRLFKSWGVEEEIMKVAAEPTTLTVHRYADGKVLATDQSFDINIRKRYNSAFLDLHRVDLQRCLLARAKELGVRIQLDTRVTDIDFTSTKVVTQSGDTYSGDLIVAADGLWSKCREKFLGSKDDPLPTGDLAYRIVLTLDEVSEPDLREWISKPACHFWVGPGAHAVAYSLRAGQMYNIVLLVPDDLPKEVAKQTGSVDEMKKLFHGWDPILTRFLLHVKSVDKWKLMHRPELESWINEAGNFVMIGDSCHPMLPYLAQGANSSMEDGAVLGGLLRHCPSKAELKGTLELFQSLRKKRGEAIVRETFAQREDFHMYDGPEQERRDKIFLSQLGKEIKGAFPSRWTCPVVQPWLYGYDAEKDVEEIVDRGMKEAAITEHGTTTEEARKVSAG